MLRRLAVLVCLSAAPALAGAQTLTINEGSNQDGYINIAECNNTKQDTLSFQWTVSSTTTNVFDLFVSNTSGCPTATSTTNLNAISSFVATVTGTATTGSLAGQQTASQLLSSVQIPCSSSTSALWFCVFATGTQNTTTGALVTNNIKLDLLTPTAPTITSVTPGDGALNVSWSNAGSGGADAGTPGAATRYTISVVPADAAPKEVTDGRTDGRIEGLTIGTQYSVTVTALTVGGNPSLPSEAATGTTAPFNTVPVAILDFWRLYQQDRGREQGGCATGAAGLTALLALAPLLWRRRRGGGRS